MYKLRANRCFNEVDDRDTGDEDVGEARRKVEDKIISVNLRMMSTWPVMVS
jgi:hypothetical protein